VRTHPILSSKCALVSSLVSAAVAVAVLVFPVGNAAASTTGTAPLQPAAGQYFPVAPVQALNTGNGTGGVPVAPMAGGSTVEFPVDGVGGVPASGVSAVYAVFNVINPSSNGCLDDFSSDVSDPNICTTTADAGNNVTDSDIVQVSESGDISVSWNSAGTADVVVTVMGYYQDNLQAQLKLGSEQNRR
jgi:hypothetical protein